MELEAAFLHIIELCEPGSLLCGGKAARGAAENWLRRSPKTLMENLDEDAPLASLPKGKTVDLTVLSGCLESLDKKRAELLLGQLRNFVSGQIVVHTRDNGPLAFPDFIALGFKRWDCPSGEAVQGHIYTYDIASYNHKRQWNTPENWANPENWDKYRW